MCSTLELYWTGVGCAMVMTVDYQLKHLLSPEVVDLVRICANSSHLATLQHLYNSSGYHTVEVIPTGARNVRIAETTSTIQTYLGTLLFKRLSGIS